MTAEDIHAIRAGAVAIVAQCDAALARMQREAYATHVESSSAHSADVQAACGHERVIRVGVMGTPMASKCLGCGAHLEMPAESVGAPA